MSSLSLHQIRKQFGDVVAVHEMNLHVNHGEFLCILGPSGCGKSTALRMIAGFEEPTAGDIRIDDRSIGMLPPNKRPTAMVFQKYTLWPHMRVYENIAFGLRLHGFSRKDIDEKVNGALELVGLPAYGKRFPSQLSGGEQQRIALARALVLQPKILLLDEPFSNLDALLRVRLREELRRIQRQVNITAIFVTHDQEEALSLADRIAVMNKGRIEQLDHPSRIYEQPQTLFVADFIGVMNLLQVHQNGSEIIAGSYRMDVPLGTEYSGDITLAVRPEDLAVASSGTDGAWNGQVEHVIDLGHYRKVLVRTEHFGVLKVYLSKAVDVREATTLALQPTRYTIFRDHQTPIEVRADSVPQLSLQGMS